MESKFFGPRRPRALLAIGFEQGKATGATREEAKGEAQIVRHLLDQLDA